MKRTFWLGLSGVVVLSLTGCYNIYTTSDNPVQDMRLRGSVRVTGFDLSVPVEQVTSKSEGKANATSGDKSADAKGAATSERTRYVYLNNGHQAVGETLRKYLEERGLNVRSDKYTLRIAGEIGPGQIDFSMLYVDLPINLVGLTGMIGSTRQSNWCELRIYKADGAFVKKYKKEASFNHISWSPIPLFGVYGDILHFDPAKSIAAGTLALQLCLRDFLEDCSKGVFLPDIALK